MIRPHYKVKDKIHFNKFQAYEDSIKNNSPLVFDLYESQFDQVSWDEPQLTWDNLLDIRANQIAAKNKPIVLNFSGGTDSWTIYQVFKRNNIKIDILHLATGKDPLNNLIDKGTIDFLKNTNLDSEVVISEEIEENLNLYYSSPDWVWTKNGRMVFSNGLSETQQFEYRNHQFGKKYVRDDFIQIVGFDKPRLHFDGESFYSYQDDTTFLAAIDSDRICPFFVSGELPELHIKQSYILAKHVLAKSKIDNKPIDYYNNIYDATKHDYYDYAYKGCGRFGEISKSVFQKQFNRRTKLILDHNDIKLYKGKNLQMLTEGLKENKSYAKNYINGLIQLRNDPILKTIFRDTENYFSFKDIHSKQYKLNFKVT